MMLRMLPGSLGKWAPGPHMDGWCPLWAPYNSFSGTKFLPLLLTQQAGHAACWARPGLVGALNVRDL
jgi:hypothetical protein